MREDRKVGERRGGYTPFDEMVRRCQFGGEVITNKDLQGYVGGYFLFVKFHSFRPSQVYGRTSSTSRFIGKISELSATFPVVNFVSSSVLHARPRRRFEEAPEGLKDGFVFVMHSWREDESIAGIIQLFGEEDGTHLFLVPSSSLADWRLEGLPFSRLD